VSFLTEKQGELQVASLEEVRCFSSIPYHYIAFALLNLLCFGPFIHCWATAQLIRLPGLLKGLEEAVLVWVQTYCQTLAAAAAAATFECGDLLLGEATH